MLMYSSLWCLMFVGVSVLYIDGSGAGFDMVMVHVIC